MSFYEELARVYRDEQEEAAHNPLVAFSDRMLATPNVGTLSGRGFLENFVANALPNLTGALAHHIGSQQVADKRAELAAVLSGMPRTGEYGEIAEYFNTQGRPDLALPALAAQQASQDDARQREQELELFRTKEDYKTDKQLGLEKFRMSARAAADERKRAAAAQRDRTKQEQLRQLAMTLGGGKGASTNMMSLSPAEQSLIQMGADPAKVVLGAQDRSNQYSRDERKEAIDLERRAVERIEKTAEAKAYKQSLPYIQDMAVTLDDPHLDQGTKSYKIITDFMKTNLAGEAINVDDVKRVLAEKGVEPTIAALSSYINGGGLFDDKQLKTLARGASLKFQELAQNYQKRYETEKSRLSGYSELNSVLDPDRALPALETYKPRFLKGTSAEKSKLKEGEVVRKGGITYEVARRNGKLGLVPIDG